MSCLALILCRQWRELDRENQARLIVAQNDGGVMERGNRVNQTKAQTRPRLVAAFIEPDKTLQDPHPIFLGDARTIVRDTQQNGPFIRDTILGRITLSGHSDMNARFIWQFVFVIFSKVASLGCMAHGIFERIVDEIGDGLTDQLPVPGNFKGWSGIPRLPRPKVKIAPSSSATGS